MGQKKKAQTRKQKAKLLKTIKETPDAGENKTKNDEDFYRRKTPSAIVSKNSGTPPQGKHIPPGQKNLLSKDADSNGVTPPEDKAIKRQTNRILKSSLASNLAYSEGIDTTEIKPVVAYVTGFFFEALKTGTMPQLIEILKKEAPFDPKTKMRVLVALQEWQKKNEETVCLDDDELSEDETEQIIRQVAEEVGKLIDQQELDHESLPSQELKKTDDEVDLIIEEIIGNGTSPEELQLKQLGRELDLGKEYVDPLADTGVIEQSTGPTGIGLNTSVTRDELDELCADNEDDEKSRMKTALILPTPALPGQVATNIEELPTQHAAVIDDEEEIAGFVTQDLNEDEEKEVAQLLAQGNTKNSVADLDISSLLNGTDEFLLNMIIENAIGKYMSGVIEEESRLFKQILQSLAIITKMISDQKHANDNGLSANVQSGIDAIRAQNGCQASTLETILAKLEENGHLKELDVNHLHDHQEKTSQSIQFVYDELQKVLSSIEKRPSLNTFGMMLETKVSKELDGIKNQVHQTQAETVSMRNILDAHADELKNGIESLADNQKNLATRDDVAEVKNSVEQGTQNVASNIANTVIQIHTAHKALKEATEEFDLLFRDTLSQNALMLKSVQEVPSLVDNIQELMELASILKNATTQIEGAESKINALANQPSFLWKLLIGNKKRSS